MGMKQRLTIGVSILHKPRILILDEPTIGLHPCGAKDLRTLVREELCSAEGVTVCSFTTSIAKVSTHLMFHFIIRLGLHRSYALFISALQALAIGLTSAWFLGSSWVILAAPLLPLLYFVNLRVQRLSRSRSVAWPLLSNTYIIFSFACITLPMCCLWLLLWAAVLPVFLFPPWLEAVMSWMGSIAIFGVGTYAFSAGRLRVRVNRIEVVLSGLDPLLDGLRIAHLSDIHLGAFNNESTLSRCVAQTNKQNPDLVVLSGDIVDAAAELVGNAVEKLQALRAPLGVFAVLGNHDAAIGRQYFEDAFHNSNVRLLIDEVVQYSADDGQPRDLGIIGLGCPARAWPDVSERVNHDMVRKLVGSLPQTATKLLLSHHPEAFIASAVEGVELTLAGHTHGGQFGIPWFDRPLTVARIFTQFPSGIYQRGKSVLYVSTGVGVGIIPARLGISAEIALLTLRRA